MDNAVIYNPDRWGGSSKKRFVRHSVEFPKTFSEKIWEKIDNFFVRDKGLIYLLILIILYVLWRWLLP